METIFVFDSKTAIAASGGTDQNFVVNFQPPLPLDPSKQYEIALVEATLWNSWHNITADNNRLDFDIPAATTLGGLSHSPAQPAVPLTTIRITPGAYNIVDINTAIQTAMKAAGVVFGDGTSAGTYEPAFELKANNSTLKSEMTLRNTLRVYFNVPNSIAPLIGFTNTTDHSGGVEATFTSPNRVDITQVQQILFHCSLVSESSLNGQASDVISVFVPNRAPGYLLEAKPNQLVNVPVTRTSLISQVRMRVTDQSGADVNLNSERVTYYLRFRERT